MTTPTNNFDAKVRELQSKLDAVHKTMREMPYTSRCGHTTAAEALATAKVDVVSQGFNALVNVRFERHLDRNPRTSL